MNKAFNVPLGPDAPVGEILLAESAIRIELPPSLHKLAVGVLMQSEDQNTRKALADIAAHELSKGLQSPFAKVWMPVLMQLNPEAGVSALETGLKVIQPSQRGEGVDWFSVLFGRDRR